MCGIIGWNGSNPKKFNKLKFDILGIYNDSRGGDSCGVTTDGEIYYGATPTTKHYRDFIVEKNYLTPNIFPVVIGHTRKSSVGVINENNAHPFGFGLNEKHECYQFLGVHNGTLYNHDEFAKNYDVKTSVYKKDNFFRKTFVRNKIDSEILLECIFKSKNFKVLSEYVGGAALLFTDTNEPNVLYAFHGASPIYTNGKLEEERPLFYYKESKNSIYISSLKESLIAIGGIENETVFSFECNIVYKIKNGDIENAELIQISRNTVLQKKSFVGHHHNNITAYSSHIEEYFSDDIEKKDIEVLEKKTKKEERSKSINNIYDDIVYRNSKSPIVFNKLRYKRNGHLINGLHTFIPEYGIIPLHVEPHELNNKLVGLIGSVFNKNTGLFTGSSIISDLNSDNFIIPFPASKGNSPSVLYFHQGILLETKEDYEACNRIAFSFEQLSHASKHPIIDIEYDYRQDQKITFKGELYTGNFSSLDSGRIFYVTNGNLNKIVNVQNEIKLNILNNKIENNFITNKVIPLSTSSLINIDENNSDNNDDNLIDKPIVNFLENNSYNEFDKKKVEDLIIKLYEYISDANITLSNIKDKNLTDKFISTNNEYLECLQDISENINA